MTSVTSVVPSASCALKPSAVLRCAIEVAMALRKMSPTSCTCTGPESWLVQAPVECNAAVATGPQDPGSLPADAM